MLFVEVCVWKELDLLNGTFRNSTRRKVTLKRSNSLQPTDVNKQHETYRQMQQDWVRVIVRVMVWVRSYVTCTTREAAAIRMNP
jgi:hypothetical protein